MNSFLSSGKHPHTLTPLSRCACIQYWPQQSIHCSLLCVCAGDYIALQQTFSRKYVVCLGGGIGCVPLTCTSPGRCGNDEFQLLKNPTSKDRFIRSGDKVALGMGLRQRVQCSGVRCMEVSCSKSFSGMTYQWEACRSYMYQLWSPHRRRGEVIRNGDRIFLRSASNRTNAIYCSKKKCQMRRMCILSKDICNPIAGFTAVKIRL